MLKNGDGADFIARKQIQIISTEDTIEITSPKKIIFRAGGSQLVIQGAGIFPTTGGKFESKAGQHLFFKGESISYCNIPFLPDNNRFNLRFYFTDDDGNPYSNIGYIATFNNGTIKKGKTNKDGFTEVFYTDRKENIDVRLEI